MVSIESNSQSTEDCERDIEEFIFKEGWYPDVVCLQGGCCKYKGFGNILYSIQKSICSSLGEGCQGFCYIFGFSCF